MLRVMRAIVAWAVLAAACAARRVPSADEPSRAPAPTPTLARAVQTKADAAAAEPAAATAVASAETAPVRSRAFPPPNVVPPFARSAAAGDGRWAPLGDARSGDGTPLLATTVIHPHEASKFITLTLVAIDLTATRLHFLPGSDDVGKQKVPFVPGLVPSHERERLLAAFNGGFMPRHGRWGMRVGGTTIVPPREPGCTIALLEGGSVRIASWQALAPLENELRFLRQTPPCLLEHGAVHPALQRGDSKPWAGQTPGIVTRRRSAIGLSQDGRILYYAVGVETPPKLLATGLLAAGAHDAAQLDINWNWTRFFLFQKEPDNRFAVVAALVDVEHSKREYVEHASERDFFYVLRTEP